MIGLDPCVSIIIPTYNRPDSLRRTLNALSDQTYPLQQCEIIVVDDGSEVDLSFVSSMEHPRQLHHLRQSNQGATAARNAGVRASRGRFLVFLDDDIHLTSDALTRLVETLETNQDTIVLGNLRPVAPSGPTPAAPTDARPYAGEALDDRTASCVVPFTECMTGVLAVRREDILKLNMFQDPTEGKGWPNWDDVDFGYRAYLNGYKFRRSLQAVAYHRDHTLTDLTTSADRWRRAARAAVLLLQKHPRLQPHLPMLLDKSPVSITQDSPALIVDKLFHLVTAWGPVQWALEGAASLLERVAPSSRPFLLLYRWTISSYIYRGYRAGLREYGPVLASATTEGP